MPTIPVLQLLGRVLVGVGDAACAPGGRRATVVLALLGLQIGRAASMDSIVSALWGDEPTHSATNAIQVSVSSLRKLLAPTPLSIETQGGGYALRGNLDDVDAELFQRLAAEGHAALVGTAPERALQHFDGAARLWRSDPLAGLGDYRFATIARTALTSVARSMDIDRGAALCALARSDEAAALGRRVVEDDPFHEPGWDLLMRALYHGGRTQDALNIYTELRRTFADELGLEPPPALADLQRQILDRSVPAVARPTVHVKPEPEPRSISELPQLPAGIIGRERELARIAELAHAGTRLITLVGLGGIGKTTAAVTAAHRMAAGGRKATFADLAATTDAATALERLCAVASVAARSDPAGSLAAADPDLVLVADSVEQITDFGAAVARLLADTTRLQILATSRTPLHIRSEVLVQLDPLDTTPGADGPSAAVELFEQRAALVRTGLGLAAHRASVITICELAGGIPLAIEIAARRLRHLTPDVLLARLRSTGTALLDDRAPQDQPARQTSLRTVLHDTTGQLSAGALDAAHQLAVLNGPITLTLLMRVLADAPAMDGLESLIDAGLVSAPDATERVRMPIPVAEYFTGPRSGGDRHRLADGVLDFAESLALQVDHQGGWAETALVADNAAVVVACATAIGDADIARALRLCVALRRYWIVGGWTTEALDYTTDVVGLSGQHPLRDTARLIQGQFAVIAGRPDAGELLRSALPVAGAAMPIDEGIVINSWCYLSDWCFYSGDIDGAREAAERVDALGKATADPAVAALSRDFVAYIAEQIGDVGVAARLGAQALAEARTDDNVYALIDLLHRNARIQLMLDDADAADAMASEAMERATTTPVGPLVAATLITRAAVDLHKGRVSAAIGAAIEALRVTTTVFPSFSSPATRSEALRVLAGAWAVAGDHAAAADCDVAADALSDRSDAPAYLHKIIARTDALLQELPAQTSTRAVQGGSAAWIEQLIRRYEH